MRVLYIDEESSQSLVKKRLHKLLRAKNTSKESLEIFFLIGQGLCFDDKASVERLRELIENLRPRLIIVDSLIRVHRSEENSAKEMSKVFDIIKKIVREYRCTFLFADHQRKLNQFGGGQDQLLRGSTEKMAFVDTVLSLKRKNNLLIVEHSKSRFDEAVPSFIIEIKDPIPDESTQVTYVGEAEGRLQEERLRTVGDFLKSVLGNRQWISRKDLVEKSKIIPISEKMMDEALKNHLESGLIERDDRKPMYGPGGKAAFYRWKINNDSSLFPTTEMETEMNTVTQ